LRAAPAKAHPLGRGGRLFRIGQSFLETNNETTKLVYSHCRNVGSRNERSRPSAECAPICIPRQLAGLRGWTENRKLRGRADRHRTIVAADASRHISVGVSPVLQRTGADRSQALLKNSECTGSFLSGWNPGQSKRTVRGDPRSLSSGSHRSDSDGTESSSKAPCQSLRICSSRQPERWSR
jgi:hypothetical protein